MKLSTDIKPRGDGTVLVLGEDGKTYVFKGDPLECDIEHEPTLARLLTLDFFPASDADQDTALALVQAHGAETAADLGDDDADDLDDLDELPVDMNAPPVESSTPPAPAPAAEPAAAPAPAKGSRKQRAS